MNLTMAMYGSTLAIVSFGGIINIFCDLGPVSTSCPRLTSTC